MLPALPTFSVSANSEEPSLSNKEPVVILISPPSPNPPVVVSVGALTSERILELIKLVWLAICKLTFPAFPRPSVLLNS